MSFVERAAVALISALGSEIFCFAGDLALQHKSLADTFYGIVILLPFTLIVWVISFPVVLGYNLPTGRQVLFTAALGLASGPLAFFFFGVYLHLTSQIAGWPWSLRRGSIRIVLWPSATVSGVATLIYLVANRRLALKRIQSN